MSAIKLPLLFVGSKGERKLFTLFDSGANLSCINPDFVKELATLESLGRPRKIATTSEAHFIEVKSRISVDFYIDERYRDWETDRKSTRLNSSHRL